MVTQCALAADSRNVVKAKQPSLSGAGSAVTGAGRDGGLHCAFFADAQEDLLLTKEQPRLALASAGRAGCPGVTWRGNLVSRVRTPLRPHLTQTG